MIFPFQKMITTMENDIPPQQETKEFALFEDLIPEDNLPIVGLRMVLYVDEEGDLVYNWESEGNPEVTSILGLIELVKNSMFNSSECDCDD